LVVDRLLRLVSVDLAVRHQSEDQQGHRYHSDLVVVLQNVDQEVAASLSAGTFVVLICKVYYCYSILQVLLDVADLDRILAVSRRDHLHREIETGKEIGKGIERETVIVTVIATATETASGIEIVIYCPDIDHQLDHLRGMLRIISSLYKRHLVKCILNTFILFYNKPLP